MAAGPFSSAKTIQCGAPFTTFQLARSLPPSVSSFRSVFFFFLFVFSFNVSQRLPLPLLFFLFLPPLSSSPVSPFFPSSSWLRSSQLVYPLRDSILRHPAFWVKCSGCVRAESAADRPETGATIRDVRSRRASAGSVVTEGAGF